MKRTETTTEQWRQLYEVAETIKRIQPWNFLTEDDIVTIQLPDRNEPIFCSVIGAAGEMFAVIVYPDIASFAERIKMAAGFDMPSYIMTGRQNCLMCNFADRDELSKRDLSVIKALGLKFRGRNQWIYFNSFKPGFAPYIIDAAESDIMIGALQNFIMALHHHIEGKLKVNFEKGKTLLRFYSKEKNLWFNAEADMPKILPPMIKSVTIRDELFTARLNALKQTKIKIEIELFYLPAEIKTKNGEPSRYPRMCLISDRANRQIIDQYILQEDDVEEQIVIGMLGDCFSQFGKPQTIFIRDDDMLGLIGNLCEKCGIKVSKSNSLGVIDSFVESFISKLYF